MGAEATERALVTGASGFIGRALVPALLGRGYGVVATSRRPVTRSQPGVEWRTCDLLQATSLQPLFEGVSVAYFLVHSMGGGDANYRELERRSAHAFADAAARAEVRRIVYLGGPAPAGTPSEHLQSRLEVGEILRAGPVPVVELRASMVVGHGSASWQIVRDLAMRLPVMLLPKWLGSRTRPVALDDVVHALVAAASLDLAQSEWFDVPGPEILNGKQILERIAAVAGRNFLAIDVPLLTPRLSALWLRLVTRTNFALARELVVGLEGDLLPRDERYWSLIRHAPLISFDDAVRRALANE